MYLSVPLIVVILLQLALADGYPPDRRWVGVAVEHPGRLGRIRVHRRSPHDL